MATATTSASVCTTQVFLGARELARRVGRRSRRERGIDDHLAHERAQSFDRLERAEMRRLFFEIADES